MVISCGLVVLGHSLRRDSSYTVWLSDVLERTCQLCVEAAIGINSCRFVFLGAFQWVSHHPSLSWLLGADKLRGHSCYFEEQDIHVYIRFILCTCQQ